MSENEAPKRKPRLISFLIMGVLLLGLMLIRPAFQYLSELRQARESEESFHRICEDYRAEARAGGPPVPSICNP